MSDIQEAEASAAERAAEAPIEVEVEVEPSSEAAGSPAPDSPEGIRANMIQNFKGIYDPEIPVDIYELGLIYRVDVKPDRSVDVDMTLTSPMCPTAQMLVEQVEMAAKDTPYVTDANVELVWDPPWDMEKMSEEARLLLGF